MVTLCSPQLFKLNTRILLLHLKALDKRPEARKVTSQTERSCASLIGLLSLYLPQFQGEESKKSSKGTNQNPGSSSGMKSSKKAKDGKATLTQLLGMPVSDCFDDEFESKPTNPSEAANPSKSEALFGCDWLDELSITVRKHRTTPISTSRTQRLAMLESSHFHEKLLQVVAATDSSTPRGAS